MQPAWPMLYELASGPARTPAKLIWSHSNLWHHATSPAMRASTRNKSQFERQARRTKTCTPSSPRSSFSISVPAASSAACLASSAASCPWPLSSQTSSSPHRSAISTVVRGRDCRYPDHLDRAPSMLDVAKRRVVRVAHSRAVGVTLRAPPSQGLCGALTARRTVPGIVRGGHRDHME